MRFLKHNWGWKLVALSLAVALQFYAGRQEDAIVRTLSVPLNLTPPDGKRVVEPEPGTRTDVRVTLNGPMEVVRGIDPEQIKASVELEPLPTGKTVPVGVQVQVSPQFQDRRLRVYWQPQTIPVRLAKNARKEVPVTVVPENKAEGWDLVRPPSATPELVTVTGPDAAVQRVAAVIAPVNLEPKEQISSSVPLVALDAAGANITELVRLRPPQVQVSGTQQRTVAQKFALVQPLLDIPPGPEVQVEVTPPRVRVQGPESVVRDVFVVETARITIPEGQTEFTQTLPVSVSNPAIASQVRLVPAQVKVTVRLKLPERPAPPVPESRVPE